MNDMVIVSVDNHISEPPVTSGDLMKMFKSHEENFAKMKQTA
jgi:hypothetical protein